MERHDVRVPKVPSDRGPSRTPSRPLTARTRPFVDALNVIAGRQELIALIVPDRNIREKSFDQGSLPDLFLRGERVSNLPLPFKKRIHEGSSG